MAVREYKHVLRRGTKPGDDLIRAAGNIRKRFAAGNAVVEQIPIRVFAPNIHGAPSLVGTVIPLLQMRVELRGRAEPGDLAGARGTNKGACVDRAEVQPAQPFADKRGVPFAAFGQRDVGAPGVLPGH